jgi:hypothetical protein
MTFLMMTFQSDAACPFNLAEMEYQLWNAVPSPKSALTIRFERNHCGAEDCSASREAEPRRPFGTTCATEQSTIAMNGEAFCAQWLGSSAESISRPSLVPTTYASLLRVGRKAGLAPLSRRARQSIPAYRLLLRRLPRFLLLIGNMSMVAIAGPVALESPSPLQPLRSRPD